MPTLKVAILGLNRLGVSVGLALRRYARGEAKYQFDVIGHDYSAEVERKARELGAIARAERGLEEAVRGADIVVLALGYEDLRDAYKRLASTMRSGVVVLDCAPLKAKSLAWASKSLQPEQHWIGFSPMFNPTRMFEATQTLEAAREDDFDQGAIIITPTAASLREAVDLASNFALVLGGKPRFLDPEEHDALLATSATLPDLLGVALFSALRGQVSWEEDGQWLTPPSFGAMTRVLKETHPDGLRDTWIGNREALLRAMDGLLEQLEEVRERLEAYDQDAIEAWVVRASDEYATWVNRRHRADWDAPQAALRTEAGGSVMSLIFGSKLAERFSKKGGR